MQFFETPRILKKDLFLFLQFWSFHASFCEYFNFEIVYFRPVKDDAGRHDRPAAVGDAKLRNNLFK